MTSMPLIRPLIRSVGLVSCLALVGSLGAQTLRIGTLDAERNGATNFFDGELTDDFRVALSARIDELNFADYEIIPLSEVTPDALGDVHVVIIQSLFATIVNGSISSAPMPIPPSMEEQDALREFVLEGGAALILADGADVFRAEANALANPFGLVVDGRLASDGVQLIEAAREHPVLRGPFGAVSQLEACFTGWFTDLGQHAAPLATLQDNGQPVAAVIEWDAIAPGSGRVFFAGHGSWLLDFHFSKCPYLHEGENEALVFNTLAWLTEEEEPPAERPTFIRSDCDGDGDTTGVTDAVFLLAFTFGGGTPPPCRAACDTNADGEIEGVTDALHTLNFRFLGGSPPEDPFPACGPETVPEESALECGETTDCDE